MKYGTGIIGWIVYVVAMLAIVLCTVIAARAGVWGAYPEPTVRYASSSFSATDEPVLELEQLGDSGIWIVHDGDELLYAGDFGACLNFAAIWGSYPIVVKGPRGTAAAPGKTV